MDGNKVKKGQHHFTRSIKTENNVIFVQDYYKNGQIKFAAKYLNIEKVLEKLKASAYYFINMIDTSRGYYKNGNTLSHTNGDDLLHQMIRSFEKASHFCYVL